MVEYTEYINIYKKKQNQMDSWNKWKSNIYLMEFNKVNNHKWVSWAQGSVSQGPGAGDDNDIGQSLCSNGRHIPPTAQTLSCHHHCTDYAQPEVILCSDTGVLSPHTAFKKDDVVAGYLKKKYFFSNVQCN